MAVCIAIIGKDNGPMFFRTRQTGVEELQYHFIVSSALDIIEERVQSSGKSTLPGVSNPASVEVTRELYLSALTAQEDYKVYGYMTNTKIKFVIVIEENSTPLMRENDIRTMFRKLHSAFCDLMSNPFYLPGTEIRSKRFNDVVNAVMSS